MNIKSSKDRVRLVIEQATSLFQNLHRGHKLTTDSLPSSGPYMKVTSPLNVYTTKQNSVTVNRTMHRNEHNTGKDKNPTLEVGFYKHKGEPVVSSTEVKNMSSIKTGDSPHAISTPRIIPKVSWFRTTPQLRTFWAGGVTLFFTFLLIIGAIRPIISDIVRIKNQLKTYRRIAVKLDNKIESIYYMKSILSSKKNIIADFDIYYPYNTDYSLFAANLEYITRQVNVGLLSISYSEHGGNFYAKEFAARGVREISPVVFTITIQGNYNNLITFLKQLEDTPYLPHVITMGYRADRQMETQTFMIKVMLFRLKKPLLKLKSNEDILQYVSSTQ